MNICEARKIVDTVTNHHRKAAIDLMCSKLTEVDFSIARGFIEGYDSRDKEIRIDSWNSAWCCKEIDKLNKAIKILSDGNLLEISRLQEQNKKLLNAIDAAHDDLTMAEHDDACWCHAKEILQEALKEGK